MANSVIYVKLDLIDKPRRCEVFFDYYKGTPGKFDGHPDDRYDSEPDEIEVSSMFYGEIDLSSLLLEDGIEDYIIECIKGRIDDE